MIDTPHQAPRRPPAGLIIGIVVCLILALCAGFFVGRHRSAAAAPVRVTFSDQSALSAPRSTPSTSTTASSSPSAPAVSAPTAAQTPLSTVDSSAYAFCAACHRPTGTGMPGAFPSLIGSERLVGNERQAIAIVLHGIFSQSDASAPRWSGRMVSLAQLSDQQIADAVSYARQAWGNHANRVSAEQVANVRKEWASRTTPWTPAELRAAFPPTP